MREEDYLQVLSQGVDGKEGGEQQAEAAREQAQSDLSMHTMIIKAQHASCIYKSFVFGALSPVWASRGEHTVVILTHEQRLRIDAYASRRRCKMLTKPILGVAALA